MKTEEKMRRDQVMNDHIEDGIICAATLASKHQETA